jgi:hypothetical protein
MKYFTYTVIGVVILAVIVGVIVVGSPTSERARQFDARRVSDLQSIQSQVVTRWQRTGNLSPSLDALRDEVSGFIVPVDPESGAAYEYYPAASTTFQLCATFATEQLTEPSALPYGAARPLGDDVWNHPAGRHCFSRTIDPAVYPPLFGNVPKASGGCVITGCSGQVCAEAEAITTCEWKPQFACYKQYSRCERAADGQCGWAQTPELMQCLTKTNPGVTPVAD